MRKQVEFFQDLFPFRVLSDLGAERAQKGCHKEYGQYEDRTHDLGVISTTL